MSSKGHSEWAALQRRYPGLEFVDKGENIRHPWLRFQAHHVMTEFLVLPAIHRVRAAVCQNATFRKMVAYGSGPDEVAQLLAKV